MSIDSGKIWDDLLKVQIDLDYKQTPSPQYIQETIFNCNEYIRKVEKHFLNVNRELTSAERLWRVEQLSIEIKKRQMLTGNERIKKLPTGREREAAVDELLEEDHKRLLDMENDVAALKNLLAGINRVQQNLTRTNADIKTLVRVMEQEIGRLNLGTPQDSELKDLMKGLSEVEQMEEEISTEDVESSEEYTTEGAGDEPPADNSVEIVTGGDGQAAAVVPEYDDTIEALLGSDTDSADQEETTEEEPVKADVQKSAPDAHSTGGTVPSEDDTNVVTVSSSLPDLDLSDIGIDLSDDDTNDTPAVKNSPPQKEEKPVPSQSTEASTKKPEEKKQAAQPSGTEGIDIDELLGSLDK